MIGGERQLFLRILSRTVAYSSCVFVPGVVVAGAYHHRPLPDLSNGNWGGPSHYTPKPVTKEQKRIRKKPFFSREAKTENEINDQSPESPGTANKSIGLPELFDATIDTGYTVSRFLVINIVNLVINMGMKSNLYNSFRTLKDERYEYLLSSIFSRDENEALITISNHCSTIDDPVLLGGILPASSVASTQFSEKFRWCLCSQEICFKNPIKSSFFGAGKVLPIVSLCACSRDFVYLNRLNRSFFFLATRWRHFATSSTQFCTENCIEAMGSHFPGRKNRSIWIVGCKVFRNSIRAGS